MLHCVPTFNILLVNNSAISIESKEEAKHLEMTRLRSTYILHSHVLIAIDDELIDTLTDSD